jgi:hypothetical protein
LLLDQTTRFKDKGAVPGRLAYLKASCSRSEATETRAQDQLGDFRDPTIIDPAGNRVHTDDGLPFCPEHRPAEEQTSSRSNEDSARPAGVE